MKRCIAIFVILIFLCGCSSVQEVEKVTEASNENESVEIEEEIPKENDEDKEVVYEPNQYGDGFAIDFCSKNDIVSNNPDIDVNRDINSLLNKMLYHIQTLAESTDSQVVFMEPQLTSFTKEDGGDPDSPTFPDNRYFAFEYNLPTKSGESYRLTVELSTWIENGKNYYDNLNGLLIKIVPGAGNLEYQAYSPEKMQVYDINGGNCIGTWSLIDGGYEATTPEKEYEENLAQQYNSLPGGVQDTLYYYEQNGLTPYLTNDKVYLTDGEKIVIWYNLNEGVWYANVIGTDLIDKQLVMTRAKSYDGIYFDTTNEFLNLYYGIWQYHRTWTRVQ